MSVSLIQKADRLDFTLEAGSDYEKQVFAFVRDFMFNENNFDLDRILADFQENTYESIVLDMIGDDEDIDYVVGPDGRMIPCDYLVKGLNELRYEVAKAIRNRIAA